MSRRFSRRTFLRLAALGGIGAGLAVIQRITAPFGPLNYYRWLLRGQAQRWVGAPAIVALGQCAPLYDAAEIARTLRECWRLADMPTVRGKRILIKPNLVDVVENHPATTAPEVVGALVDMLAELGAAEIIVGDGPAFRRDAVAVAEECGLAAILAARGVRFVDLNYDDLEPAPVRDGWLRRAPVLWLPRTARQADLIVSAPKLKTHHWAGVSLSLKNLLGVIPGARYGWPKNAIHIGGISATILSLYQMLPPVVAVVDGIVGIEGDGPLFGEPVAHGLLAVGRDAVAVDVVCAQLMGFEIKEIEHLALAAWAGTGQATRIEARGVPPASLQRRYQRPPS